MVDEQNKKVTAAYDEHIVSGKVQKISKLYDGRIEAMNGANREWRKVHNAVYGAEPDNVKFNNMKSEITTLYMHLLTNGKKDLVKKMLINLCYFEAMNGEKLADLRMDSLLYTRLDSQA